MRACVSPRICGQPLSSPVTDEGQRRRVRKERSRKEWCDSALCACHRKTVQRCLCLDCGKLTELFAAPETAPSRERWCMVATDGSSETTRALNKSHSDFICRFKATLSLPPCCTVLNEAAGAQRSGAHCPSRSSRVPDGDDNKQLGVSLIARSSMHGRASARWSGRKEGGVHRRGPCEFCRWPRAPLRLLRMAAGRRVRRTPTHLRFGGDSHRRRGSERAV